MPFEIHDPEKTGYIPVKHFKNILDNLMLGLSKTEISNIIHLFIYYDKYKVQVID